MSIYNNKSRSLYSFIGIRNIFMVTMELEKILKYINRDWKRIFQTRGEAHTKAMKECLVCSEKNRESIMLGHKE